MTDQVKVQESEEVILGSLLIDPELIGKTSKLKIEDFTGTNRVTFEVIRQLTSEGKSVDLTSVIQSFKLTGQDRQENLTYLSELVSKVSSLEAIDTHIDLVAEAGRKNRARTALEATLKETNSWENTTEELWLRLNEQFFSILQDERNMTSHVFSGGGEQGIYEQRMRILKDKESASPLFTGWQELDDMLPAGFARKDVSVIAARPGMGKSSFRFNLERQFLDQGFGGVLISTEQSQEVETDRQDSIMTGIPTREVARSQFWDREDPRLHLIKEINRKKDETWNYDMLFGRQLNVSRVWEFMSTVTRRRKKDYLVIDLFDRLTDVNVTANKPMTVSKKLGEMSALAEYFNIHVCLIVQVSRQAERAADKRPKLMHLKDSGNYEEAARLIIMLYRDAYYNPESLSNVLEVNIAKQNQGESGTHATVQFLFEPETLIQTPLAHRGY